MKINELLARLFSRGVSGRVRLVVGLLGVVPLGALAAVNAAPSFDLPRIYSTNEVRAWGDNSSGKLGDNTQTERDAPVPVLQSGVLAGRTVVAVAAGASHSLALCADGTVAAWGNNLYGQ